MIDGKRGWQMADRCRRAMKVEASRVLDLAPPSWKKRSFEAICQRRTFRWCTSATSHPYEPRRALVAFSYARRPVVAKEIRNKGERTPCGRPRWFWREREREKGRECALLWRGKARSFLVAQKTWSQTQIKRLLRVSRLSIVVAVNLRERSWSKGWRKERKKKTRGVVY